MRLAPGQRIGILGGGQLGRMLALAAAPLGLETVVYSEDADCPAFAVTPHHIVGSLDDTAALEAFARSVPVVTFETENIPLSAAETIAAVTSLRPGTKALSVAQDRLNEKEFVTSLGIPTGTFAGFADAGALETQGGSAGFPAVMKTRRMGYDGKGQVKVDQAAELQAAWERIGRQPAILEAFIPFASEVSVVAARGPSGEFVAYDVVENRHEHHILATSTVPAKLSADIQRQACASARRIADALDYVGVFAVEFFVTGDGGLLFNEIAPRVHNSGHWTIEGAETSQFEQHIRAIAGWPLGAATRLFPHVVMENLIGDAVKRWPELAAEPHAHLHLYGKTDARPGRKMGHVTRLQRD